MFNRLHDCFGLNGSQWSVIPAMIIKGHPLLEKLGRVESVAVGTVKTRHQFRKGI